MEVYLAILVQILTTGLDLFIHLLRKDMAAGVEWLLYSVERLNPMPGQEVHTDR